LTIDSDAELEWTQERIVDLVHSLAEARRSLAESPGTLTDLLSLYQHELDELQSEVRAYLGLSRVEAAPVELGFETKDGASGTTTLSALGKVVNGVGGVLTSIGERLVEGRVRESGRPQARIMRAVDFRVVGVAPGSFNLLLELPLPPEEELDEETRNLGERSLNILEEAAQWINTDDRVPPGALADPGFRQLVLDGLKSLAPSDASTIKWIELRRKGAVGVAPTRLTRETYHRISEIMEGSAPSESVVIRGTLREIDLEHGAFDVYTSERVKQRCKAVGALLTQALDHIHSQTPVLVRGVRSGATLDVISIEQIADVTDHS
jgi:hypothetical protein